MPRRVYLDHAATTPLDGRVFDAMLPHLRGETANPSSLHAPGAAAREAVEEARASVARLVGAAPGEIVFTSGGTESDNLAVFGLAAASPEKRHAIVSAVEHPAVREAAVIGVEDDHWGEAVVAFVALEPGADVAPGEIIAACKSETADYKVPKRVLITDTLPKNPTGKVERGTLRKLYREQCEG